MNEQQYLTIRVLSDAFGAAGKELYLVGGAVRDTVMNRPVKDLDFATNATPEESKRIIATCTQVAGFWPAGERFGTVACYFYGAPHERVEVTTYRGEHYTPLSRRPDVTWGSTIHDDLSRRDFTFNAMAMSLHSDEIYDPFGGQADIGLKTIKAVGDAAERFREDPLRILRAARFAAQLSFRLDEQTLDAACEADSATLLLAQERITAELDAILRSDLPSRGLNYLIITGVMRYIFPEYLAMNYCDQNPRYHNTNVLRHTLRVVDAVVPNSNEPFQCATRWAALLHDVGKPAVRTGKNIHEYHFKGHEDAGAIIAPRIMERMRLPNSLIRKVTRLVQLHMRPMRYEREWSNAAVRRFVRECGDDLDLVLALARADCAGLGQERVLPMAAKIDHLDERCRAVVPAEVQGALESPLTGTEIMEAMGLAPGPRIGELKKYLSDAVVDGLIDPGDKEAARAMLLKA